MWITGLVLVALIVVGLLLWLRWRQQRGDPPPELESHEDAPPDARDATWDPRERYDD